VTTWSRQVADLEEAAAALAEPGDALDLRAPAALDERWRGLGFAELVPGELVRPVPQLLDSVEQTRALGGRLAAGLSAGDLVVLSGPLGAGKTALTQGIGAALGVHGPVTSPTFVLARVHRGPLPLVHVDAYRLRDSGMAVLELDDLDLDADLPDSVVVVEWGEGLVEGLTPSRLEVRLDRPTGRAGPSGHPRDADVRTALVRAYGPRWASALP
jgi:tRNA threonylcarbamoyladenosine biosynthesis protein TsaE